MSQSKERRAHPRVSVQVEVERDRDSCVVIKLGPKLNLRLEIDADNDHNFYAGLTSDISEGGVFIATSSLLPMGTNVVMSIQLPSSPEAYDVEGVVRWCREPEVCFGGAVPGYGVQFGELAPEVVTVIQAYVARHETIYFEAA